MSFFAFGAYADPPADVPPTPPGDATTLDTVMVTGEQPGPGMWKVTNGDHVLWILATAYPLPKKMVWQSKQVDDTIAQSQEVIANVAGKLDISFFHKVTLLPAAIRSARANSASPCQCLCGPSRNRVTSTSRTITSANAATHITAPMTIRRV